MISRPDILCLNLRFLVEGMEVNNINKVLYNYVEFGLSKILDHSEANRKLLILQEGLPNSRMGRIPKKKKLNAEISGAK